MKGTINTTDDYIWGSRTCETFNKGKKCDLCSHVIIRDHFHNTHTNQKFRVYGHLRHDYAPTGILRWFVYVKEDIICKIYQAIII